MSLQDRLQKYMTELDREVISLGQCIDNPPGPVVEGDD